MTEHPTDAMLRAGGNAYHLTRRNEPLDTRLTDKICRAIYLAMEAAKPSTPIDDEGLEKLIEAVTDQIGFHWRGFRSWEDIVEELPAVIRDEAAKLRAPNVS